MIGNLYVRFKVFSTKQMKVQNVGLVSFIFDIKIFFFACNRSIFRNLISFLKKFKPEILYFTLQQI